MDILLQRIEVYLLIFTRVISFFVVAPVFNQQSFVHQARIGLSIVISILLFPVVAMPNIPLTNAPGYMLLVGKEILVGLILGYTVDFIFHGVRFAGHVLGYQLGFAIVSTIDPQTSEQISIIGQLKWLTAVMIFILIDGHYLLLEALAYSFRAIPLTAAAFPSGIAGHVLRLSAQIFIIGIQIAAPVMVTLLMTNVGMGILARTVPQMNIFVVGFPLTITVGLISIMITLPIFGVFVQKLLQLMRTNLGTVLQLIAG